MAAHLLQNTPTPLPTPELVARALAADAVAPIPGSRYVLAGLTPCRRISISQLIFDLAVRTGLHLLLVGVEDNEAIRADPDRLTHYSRRGAATAVLARSLMSRGPAASSAAEFISRGQVHIVADELLGVDRDRFATVAQAVAQLTTPESVHALMIGNTQRVLRGKLLDPLDPVVEASGSLRRIWKRVAARSLR